MKKYIIIPIVLISILFMWSCNGSEKSDKKEDKEVIKIGVLGPFTGEGATYGEAMKKGIEIAIEIINTIDSNKFYVYYQDSKLLPNEAIKSFKYLVDKEHVNIIFGPAGSNIASTLAPYANKRKVVLFSSISSSDILKDAGPYFFRNIPPNSNQVITSVDFIIDTLKLNTASILYENNDYGLNMNSIFNDYFQTKGGVIINSNSYESSQSDFKNVIIKNKKNQPDVIFIPGTYQEIGIIIRQIREMEINSVIVCGDGAYSPELIKLAGTASEGVYCTLMTIPNTDTKTYKNFEKIYRKKYNEEPNVYSVYSYDAVMMFYESTKDIPELSGQKIQEQLQTYVYNGVTGKTVFDSFNEVNKSYSMYIINNGKFEKVGD